MNKSSVEMYVCEVVTGMCECVVEHRGMNECVLVTRRCLNGLFVSVHICMSILGLVLGEQVEIFAQ